MSINNSVFISFYYNLPCLASSEPLYASFFLFIARLTIQKIIKKINSSTMNKNHSGHKNTIFSVTLSSSNIFTV